MNLIKVIGDVCQDKSSYGVITRTSEEQQGSPIISISKETFRLGMAANVAAGIFHLGAPVELFSVVGADVEGTWITNTLKSHTTRISITPKFGTLTTVKHRVFVNGIHQCRIDKEQTFPLGDYLRIHDKKEDNTKVAVFSDYGKGVLSNIGKAIKPLAERNIMCLVDPKGNDWTKYSYAYVIKPNMKEFMEYAFPGRTDAISVEEFSMKAQEIRSNLNIDNLIITSGSEGCFLYHMTGQVRYDAEKINMIDVCGAGDSTLAALAVGLNEGWDINKSIKFAMRVAGLAVSQPGTVVIEKEQVKEWFE